MNSSATPTPLLLLHAMGDELLASQPFLPVDITATWRLYLAETKRKGFLSLYTIDGMPRWSKRHDRVTG